ncbi:MAG: TM2 domain-containing protein [Chloroflexi bacterium]|nr:TM2 domain-containing protein [Chloroflexota bacterium]
MAGASNEWVRAQILMGVSIWGGWIGLDRFYNGQIGLGIIKMFTLGGFFIWWLLDAIYYTKKAGEALRK